MKKKFTRRSFFRKSAGLGAASLAGGALWSVSGCQTDKKGTPGTRATTVAVKGDDPGRQAEKAVELLGGMERFVPRGARVCILPNTQRHHPGTYTKPGMVQAVIRMCKTAGAGEVNCLSWLPIKNWEATGLAEAVEKEGATLTIVDMKDESLFRPVPVPQGVKLKEARIMDRFFDHDVFINMPICKDHAGNRFTGTMKNLMGINSPKSNRTFHTGNFKNDDIQHLDQCIVDLNTVIKPTLCVVDAWEFITTKGPFGPGELLKPMKVVAGTDRVAVDAYCASLWGLKPAEIIMIKQAHKMGLGEIDTAKSGLEEIVL